MMYRIGNQKMGDADLRIPVAAGEMIRSALMVAIGEDGYAKEAAKEENVTVAGCSLAFVSNVYGSAGDEKVPVRRGVYVWENDGTIRETDILKDAYVADERTVTLNAEGSSRVGKILAVEADGVTVDMNS